MRTTVVSSALNASPNGIGLMQSVYELLGIVLVRFRPVQRIWGAWLIAVNGACLPFITHIEAQIALAAVGTALLSQALIY